jgi:hypothetical protein
MRGYNFILNQKKHQLEVNRNNSFNGQKALSRKKRQACTPIQEHNQYDGNLHYWINYCDNDTDIAFECKFLL